jgi:SHS2 domain-containing protein
MRHAAPGAAPLWREVEHTADRGIEVEAASPAALFEKAGLALFAVMVSPVGVGSCEERLVEVHASGWTDLLHDWLAALLERFGTDAFVAAEVTVEAIAETAVRGRLRGERFDRARHEFQGEIKAVTYHQLAVARGAAGWRARVIFDV